MSLYIKFVIKIVYFLQQKAPTNLMRGEVSLDVLTGLCDVWLARKKTAVILYITVSGKIYCTLVR
jgi:hypothetical protein